MLRSPLDGPMLDPVSESAAPSGRTSSDRRRTGRRRRSPGPRVFLALMAIACLGLAVAGVVSIASGGYRPERYGNGFDPVRAAALLAFGAMTVGFALPTATALRSAWSERSVFQLGGAALGAGMTILAVAGFAFFATAYDSSAPLVPRSSIQVLAYLGLGLVAAGMAPAVLEGAAGAVRRRDPSLLIVLIALVLIVVVRLVWRD